MSGRTTKSRAEINALALAAYRRRIQAMSPSELKAYRMKRRRRFKRWYEENREYVIERVLERRHAARKATKKKTYRKGSK